MRSILIATFGVMAFAGAAYAEQAPRQPARAISAERYAVNASYSTTQREHGYTARSRRIADCLAAVASDPRTPAGDKAATDRRCTI